MNKDLAELLRGDRSARSAFEKVTLDSTRRSGLLTQAGLLASYANNNQTSPVARGFFIERSLPLLTASASPGECQRQAAGARSQAHHPRAICDSPHQRHLLELPPADGSGRARLRALRWCRTLARHRERQAVDATGDVVQTDVDGRLRRSRSSSRRSWARARKCESAWSASCSASATGEAESDADQCTLTALNTAFNSDQGRHQPAAGHADPDRRLSLPNQRARRFTVRPFRLNRRAFSRGAGGISDWAARCSR